MSLLEQVALGWQAALRTLAQLRRPATWVPWLALGAVQVLAVVLLANFAHPAISSWMAPVVRAVAGEEALHYPGLFRALPHIYAMLDLAIGAIPGAIVVGAATRLFADGFQGRSTRPLQALGEAGRRGLDLVFAQLPFHLLAAGLALGVGGWLDAQSRSRLVSVLGAVFTIGGALVVQALFFYVAALVMLEGRSAVSALRRVPRTWPVGFWAALFLGVALLVALLPFQALQGQAHHIAERGRPELTALLTLLQAAVTLILGYVLSGSAALVYLAAVGPGPAEDQ